MTADDIADDVHELVGLLNKTLQQATKKKLYVRLIEERGTDDALQIAAEVYRVELIDHSQSPTNRPQRFAAQY